MAPVKPKRRNWTRKEDVTLLRQVGLELPFTAKHGDVQAKWTAVADDLTTDDEFTREVDGKKLQNRFHSILDEHRNYDAASAKLSGASEEETERIQLLDELLCIFDDHKEGEEEVKQERKKADDKEAVAGRTVRDMAMKTCPKRKAADPDGRRSNVAFIDLIKSETETENALRKEELDFKRYKFDMEMEERRMDREERAAQRQHDLRMAELEELKLQRFHKV